MVVFIVDDDGLLTPGIPDPLSGGLSAPRSTAHMLGYDILLEVCVTPPHRASPTQNGIQARKKTKSVTSRSLNLGSPRRPLKSLADVHLSFLVRGVPLWGVRARVVSSGDFPEAGRVFCHWPRIEGVPGRPFKGTKRAGTRNQSGDVKSGLH